MQSNKRCTNNKYQQQSNVSIDLDRFLFRIDRKNNISYLYIVNRKKSCIDRRTIVFVTGVNLWGVQE